MAKPFPEAQARLKNRMEFEAFLGTLTVKDRARVEKQIATYETAGEAQRAELWKRLSCTLTTLAPHRTKINAPKSVQYYEQDGKYRRQVFAMEDSGSETVTVYCEDIADRAVEGGLLQRDPKLGSDGPIYRIVGSHATLSVERIDGAVVNPQEFFKHMVGWNRKALRITLPVTASEAQIATTELLCAISLGS